jgi:glycosyltransferase involved in cell wall biosynthesis
MLTRHSRAALRNYIHAMVLVDRLAGGGAAHGGAAHLHAHFLHSPAAIAFIAKKISGQRYSVCGHAKDIYTTLPQNLEMRCDRADFVTTCTEANRRFLVEEIGLAPSRVWLCRHGVDVERFSSNGSGPHASPNDAQPHAAANRSQPHAARNPSQPHAARIISVGRLVPKKGFDLLIRACGELRRRGVDLELKIIGGGELRDELARLAEQERVADRVKLTGSMSQEQVAAELQAAELFVLSPRVMPDGDRDGIPNVLLEAMAAGVPIVASAVSAIPEVLTDGVNARLVPPGQPKLLADAIAELLSDHAQRARLADAGERFVREECSWPSAVQPLRELLDEVLAS